MVSKKVLARLNKLGVMRLRLLLDEMSIGILDNVDAEEMVMILDSEPEAAVLDAMGELGLRESEAS